MEELTAINKKYKEKRRHSCSSIHVQNRIFSLKGITAFKRKKTTTFIFVFPRTIFNFFYKGYYSNYSMYYSNYSMYYSNFREKSTTQKRFAVIWSLNVRIFIIFNTPISYMNIKGSVSRNWLRYRWNTWTIHMKWWKKILPPLTLFDLVHVHCRAAYICGVYRNYWCHHNFLYTVVVTSLKLKQCTDTLQLYYEIPVITLKGQSHGNRVWTKDVGG